MTDDPGIDGALDELYGVAPQDFTALRTDLAAAAKKRGDRAAAKRIGAARRPTTAAWVVNVLVRSDATARPRLTRLSESLQAAHAAMDGSQIRQSSLAQRRLIDELVRAGFAAAGVTQPSAALRDDVVGTLQAAVADAGVADRLGRLTKAEKWSGFGEFGEVASVAASRGRTTRQSDPPEVLDPAEPDLEDGPTADELTAARERVAALLGDVGEAERRHAVTVDALCECEARVSTARRRYEKLLEKLSAAERELSSADTERAAAEQSAGEAADLVRQAKQLLAEGQSVLVDLGGRGSTRRR